MDKNSIRKYAVWARRELIERVAQRAMIYGVTAINAGNPNDSSVNGRLLSDTEKRQRQALIAKVNAQGFNQVIEEVAYTWFNRFAALRFMEVNGYLPSHFRVFTNDAGEFKPQILDEAINLELDGLNKNRVYELLNANKTDELFKYLIIVQCNALNKILPAMFQRIEDYTELLFPDHLLSQDSAIAQMIATIPEDDWRQQVQIIGWLYQYYNSELKDKVFADLKRNVKIAKENIPAATQLFTPDWIVHYMVENSLGRLWLEGNPNDALKLKSEWKYFLDEAEQEDSVQVQLKKIRAEFAALKPEEIRVIDPCMGSGHILCVLFDVLVRIYEDYGYTAGDAAAKIVENNLWGLDIDERAAQLAYFAVMMKARNYDRRFFTRKVFPHVFAIHESNDLRTDAKDYLNLSTGSQETFDYLMTAFTDAKEFGSIIQLADMDYRALEEELLAALTTGNLWQKKFAQEGLYLVRQAIALTQKYHVVATNPPYMGGSGMGSKLAAYVKKNFPDSKSDLSTIFMERCRAFANGGGYYSMINIPVWMFISSYEKLRRKLLAENIFINMTHNGRGIFGSDFGTVAFVVENISVKNYTGKFRRLFDAQVEVKSPAVREQEFLSGKGEHCAQQDNFSKIPGAPVAYWVSKPYIDAFANGKFLGSIADSKQGLATADNERFLRLWYEVKMPAIKFDAKTAAEALESKKKWFPYNKGGDFRKWYGNNDYVVNWENDGFEIKHMFDAKGKLRSRPQNTQFYFRECASWSLVTSSVAAFRYKPCGYIFDVAGMSFFSVDLLMYLLALCNTKITMEVLRIIAPTINFQCGDIAKIPVLIDATVKRRVEELAVENISLSRADWDAFETSWDFQEHPFIKFARAAGGTVTIEKVFGAWQDEAEERFQKLKANEEELNRIFIELYGLGAELTAEVDDKDVTVRRADLQREVRSFLSYAVGCLFGRYTLGTTGLIYAGGEWNSANYPLLQPVKHGIIPISDAEYFEEDIVNLVEKFLTAALGAATLEENLRQIAAALGKAGAAREAIRNYFINDFYADHVKIYRKRPIYWLFDSGKKNGFKCLVYMHRYRYDSIARIRTEYVHKQQRQYRMAIEVLEKRIEEAPTAKRVKLSKELEALQGQAAELRAYEEKIHHLADEMNAIDLDDGVKHNYEKFSGVLAKLK
ncbi:MAG: BREX-1 system adenine-specific DNA-methyltransferase PglX [Selenomonadaceae bacterium]|nr:BREX-1 system adenine-specific DNA-methyltransferase PglX [Selenomonadaceae bacterium]